MDDNTNFTQQAITAIQSITDEDKIDLVIDAIKDQRRHLNRQQANRMKATLKVGDLVTLTGLSPKMLNGAQCKVVEILKTRAVVTLDKDAAVSPRAANRLQGRVRIPLSCLIPVEG